jgi:hypothetical protein
MSFAFDYRYTSDPTCRNFIRSMLAWQCPWELDIRSLALSRVLLAFSVLLDLIVRVLFGGLQEHLTDVGSFPRELALKTNHIARNSFPSIYFISGNYSVSAALILLHAVVAMCMMIGYRTRWSTFFTWYMTTSLVIRNANLTSAVDELLCIVLFWSMFVPTGAIYSVDKAMTRSNTPAVKKLLRRCNPDDYTICNSGSFAMLVQVTLLYVTASLLKEKSPVWQSGTALHHVLSMRFHTLPPADWLHVRLSEQLTYIATRAAVLMQLCVPVLLWVPVRALHGKCRLYAVALLGLMHGCIAIILNVHFFVLVDLAFLTAFLPASAWNLINVATRSLRRRQQCLTVEWPCDWTDSGPRQSSIDLLVFTLHELGCLQSVALRPLHPRQFVESRPKGWLSVTTRVACSQCDFHRELIGAEPSRVDSTTMKRRCSGQKGVDCSAQQPVHGRAVCRSQEHAVTAAAAENWSGVAELLQASPVAWVLAAPLQLLLPQVLPPQSTCDGEVDEPDEVTDAAFKEELTPAGVGTSAAAVATPAVDVGWKDPVDGFLRRLMASARRGTDMMAAVAPVVLAVLVLGLNIRVVSEVLWGSFQLIAANIAGFVALMARFLT